MTMHRLRINGQIHDVDADPETPLLWVLRDHLGLTGTKYGCGVGACGVCTSIVDGQAFRPCEHPVAGLREQDVLTIEGVEDHPVQQAWLDEDVTQCGYCQPGQIMATIALLTNHPDPTDEDIDEALRHNVCRCGTHPRIRRAIRNAAARMRADS
ncbi:(2Fe-2S)-binding protein [Lentzea atacamensis]